jgi:hypothetical protein
LTFAKSPLFRQTEPLIPPNKFATMAAEKRAERQAAATYKKAATSHRGSKTKKQS